MQAASEQLEVVREDEKNAGGDERQKADAHHRDSGETKSHRTRQAHHRRGPEHAGREVGLQRAPAQLVERMRGDADRQQECGQGGGKAGEIQRRCQRRANQNIGQVPRRVWRVQDRPDVTPPTSGTGRVIGGCQDRRPFRHGACGPT